MPCVLALMRMLLIGPTPGPLMVALELSALQPDLDRVPQSLTDEDGRGDHDHDEEPGRDDQPPVPVVHVLDTAREHAAPVLLRRGGPEAPGGQRDATRAR